jgi:serine/threonine protein kinase
MLQVLETLAQLHQLGVIHGDMKALNMLVDRFVNSSGANQQHLLLSDLSSCQITNSDGVGDFTK